MSSCENEGRNGGSSDGRSNGESLLVLVDLEMPLSVDLGRSEHSSTSTHVSERSLTGSVGTTSRDTRNSGNSSTSSPGLCGCLVTGLGADGVCLSLVLGHRGVHLVDYIRSDGSRENLGESDGLSSLYGDSRSRHYDRGGGEVKAGWSVIVRKCEFEFFQNSPVARTHARARARARSIA